DYMGGPEMAPQTPQTFGAPRETRGAPRLTRSFLGARNGPPNPPNVRSAPGNPWRSSINALLSGGPEMAPKPPKRSERPGKPVALLDKRAPFWGPRDGPPNPPNVRSAPGNPWRSSINALLSGGPEMAPNPPTFGAPRETRGALR